VASFADSADYAPAEVSTTFTITQATPTVTVSDAGGMYTGKAFKAIDTIAGVSGTAAGSLQGVKPTVTYYELSAGGSYEMVAAFAMVTFGRK